MSWLKGIFLRRRSGAHAVAFVIDWLLDISRRCRVAEGRLTRYMLYPESSFYGVGGAD